jgi:hypothetical protein
MSEGRRDGGTEGVYVSVREERKEGCRKGARMEKWREESE